MLEVALTTVVLGAVYFGGDGYFTYADVSHYPPDDPYLRLENEPLWRGSCWIAMHGSEPPDETQVIMQMMSGNDDLGFQLRFIDSETDGSMVTHSDTFALTVTSKTDFGSVYTATAYGADNLVTNSEMFNNIRHDKWIHLAFHARYNQTTNGKDKLRVSLYVNGVSSEASVTASTGSVTASQRFEVTTPPTLLVGGNGVNDFDGEIGDVGLALDDWTQGLVNELYGTGKFIDEHIQNGDVGQSFGDVDPITAVAFYAPMSLDEPYHDTVVSTVQAVASTGLTFYRTLGAPICYENARPTIMIIGDTQSISPGNESNSYLRYVAQHIVNYQSTFNIRTVFHVGDWAGEWEPGESRPEKNCKYFMRSLINAGIPFSLAIGDHEYFKQGKNWRQSRCFLEEMRTLDGPLGYELVIEDEVFDTNAGFVNNLSYPNGDPIEFEEDLYTYSYTFDIDGEEHLAIVLPHGASRSQLRWAVEEAGRHDGDEGEDNLKVWIITHAWLSGFVSNPSRMSLSNTDPLEVPSSFFAKSNETDEDCVCTQNCTYEHLECDSVSIICVTDALEVPLDPDASSGEEMWDTYLSTIPNLVGIVCGHMSLEAVNICEEAANNNYVWQLLVNAQSTDTSDEDKTGFIQILRFVDADSVEVTTWGILKGTQITTSVFPRFEFMFDFGSCTKY